MRLPLPINLLGSGGLSRTLAWDNYRNGLAISISPGRSCHYVSLVTGRVARALGIVNEGLARAAGTRLASIRAQANCAAPTGSAALRASTSEVAIGPGKSEIAGSHTGIGYAGAPGNACRVCVEREPSTWRQALGAFRAVRSNPGQLRFRWQRPGAPNSRARLPRDGGRSLS